MARRNSLRRKKRGKNEENVRFLLRPKITMKEIKPRARKNHHERNKTHRARALAGHARHPLAHTKGCERWQQGALCGGP